jgi:MoCo/4Fe-4S cofactor protein with predicted Tat translocation signal
MKRVFQHPPESLTGKKYWRSLGELSDTPEFRDWLEREFPAGASELNGDDWSRRGFLKLMGASMALAGFGLSSCRRPEMHLVPFTKSAEWTIPGKPLFYATAMPRRTGAIPLVVTTHDGRPTKIDGNPLHPASGGATDAFAQASILDLYDPARSKHFLENGKISDRATFEKYLDKLRPQWMANQGGAVAFLVEPGFSPTRDRLRGVLQKVFPRLHWCEYDPLLSSAQSFAAQIGFGEQTRVVPHFERADVILALDSDFLGDGSGDLESVRAFSARRRVKESKDTMNRLYVVENRFSLTGAMADHRLRVPASQIPSFTRALAEKMLAVTKDGSLGSVVGTLPPQTGATKFDEQWVTEVINDLVAKSGASLVLAGSDQPVVVQLLVYAMNIALKNLGHTLVVR